MATQGFTNSCKHLLLIFNKAFSHASSPGDLLLVHVCEFSLTERRSIRGDKNALFLKFFNEFKLHFLFIGSLGEHRLGNNWLGSSLLLGNSWSQEEVLLFLFANAFESHRDHIDIRLWWKLVGANSSFLDAVQSSSSLFVEFLKLLKLIFENQVQHRWLGSSWRLLLLSEGHNILWQRNRLLVLRLGF